MLKTFFRIFAFAAMAAMFVIPAFAQEQKEITLDSLSKSRNRTIEINSPGSYRLGDDISVRSGDGIVINASNVTLNLNGNSISTGARGTGRGVFVKSSTNVQIKNGKINGFNSNVMVLGSKNVNVEALQISGDGLAPNGGPSEIGVLLVNCQAVFVSRNTISSVNLGVFVRGGNSAGNRIFENILVGGSNPANNLLGICYNPAANAGPAGPRGDNIYNNHISRFNFAIAISPGSQFNIFNENTTASFSGSFREPEALTQNGGTNISEGNLAVTVPFENLP